MGLCKEYDGQEDGKLAVWFNGYRDTETASWRSNNQAIKALILAGGYLKDDGFDVVFSPKFVDLDFDGRTVTAIKLIVEPR